MSLKISAFANILPAPKTQEKFYITLPGVTQAALKVSAASLPFAKRGEGVIWHLGRPFYVPTWVDQAGEWTCKWTEDLTMSGTLIISALERKMHRTFFRRGDVHIWLTDQFGGLVPQQMCTLGDAWLKDVKQTPLDWSKPTEAIQYELTFRYNRIRRLY